MREPDALKTKTDNTSVEVELLLWWEDYYLPIFEYILPQMGDLQGKKILELGTGTGGTATMLAKRGAFVTGIDLLPFRLSEARQRTLQHNVANATDFLLMDATELAFPDNTFDIIISKSVLVFTDHAEVSRECNRVLKPGGKAIFIENMRYHPVVWLYRKLFLKYSRELRYFSLADIRAIGENFREMEHREFHLMSLGALFWKRFIPIPVLYRWTLKFLRTVDDLIIRYIPMLNYFCWISAMICRK
ncbi:class I SAM-dependent methyltransferase [Candidatus Poribacteria bacterium]|nr:class I SAM-dependent methyltransferase [Candidatus Poribacteria bacterium]MYB66569.1 class I SAM-dependent methyltransferase [Candidatus Poribacteria bacterium]MYF57422.1 class I SAM-dependent methyltransferase [Candidatus Poribacteria bacterium]MYI93408.1 class I SAM-dependent methyltransferase [Candidatus Poribacteria bacterium]